MNPNYTYLYNNLSPETKKYTNMYRALSPIVIKTFGGNNFIYERKYKSNSNNDIMDSEYDYIEKELNKNKGIKPHTAYTELSTQENMSLFSSQMQKPIKRSYKHYTNINNEGEYYIYPGYDITFLKEKNDIKTRTYNENNNDYRYKFLKKEEVSEIYYPKEKLARRSDYQNYKKKQKENEYISQSFSTSIIPEKKLINYYNTNKNNKSIFEIKYIKSQKSFQNKEINLRIKKNNYPKIKRESSYSRSKEDLKDFNLDKLKEIGDNIAKRYLNKPPLYSNSNGKNQNEKEIPKEKGIVKNMIIIEEKEKRRTSKNKPNLLMKSTDLTKNEKRKNSLNSFNENKNKIKTPNKTDKIDLNFKFKEKIPKMKIINIDKKNMINLKSNSPPNTIKIKLKHKIMGKEFISNNSNSDDKSRRFNNYNYINRINNITGKNINYKNPFFQERIKRTPDKIYLKTPDKIKEFKNTYNNGKKPNLNQKFKRIDLNNINHCYLESINIKKNVKTTKTKHSFNDIFLPSQ